MKKNRSIVVCHNLNFIRGTRDITVPWKGKGKHWVISFTNGV